MFLFIIMNSVTQSNSQQPQIENSNPSTLFSTTPMVASTFSISKLFSSFNWMTWVLIFFILTFLGFNIFIYLGMGTQMITDFLKPITSYLGMTAVDTTKQIIDVSVTGVKSGVDITADTITAGLDKISPSGNNSSSSLTKGAENVNMPLLQQFKDNSLNNTLNNPSNTQHTRSPDDTPTYIGDDPYSTIQRNKSSGKSGFCYIGEDRGFRSCISVGENDMCMSEDIYPSMDICVNPSLRP